MINVPYRQLCSQGGDQQGFPEKEGVAESQWKIWRAGAGVTLRHSGLSIVSAHLEICLSSFQEEELLPWDSLCSWSSGVFTQVVAQILAMAQNSLSMGRVPARMGDGANSQGHISLTPHATNLGIYPNKHLVILWFSASDLCLREGLPANPRGNLLPCSLLI